MATSVDANSQAPIPYSQMTDDPQIVALNELRRLTNQLNSASDDGELRKRMNAIFNGFQEGPEFQKLVKSKTHFDPAAKIDSNHIIVTTRVRPRDSALCQELLPKLQKISPLMDSIDLNSYADEEKADAILGFLSKHPEECSKITCVTFEGLSMEEYLPNDKKSRTILWELFPNLNQINFPGGSCIYPTKKRKASDAPAVHLDSIRAALPKQINIIRDAPLNVALLQQILPSLRIKAIDLSNCNTNQEKSEAILEFLRTNPDTRTDIKRLTIEGMDIIGFLILGTQAQQIMRDLFPSLERVVFSGGDRIDF